MLRVFFLMLMLAGSLAAFGQEEKASTPRHAEDFDWIPGLYEGDPDAAELVVGALWLVFVDEGQHVADLGTGFTRVLSDTVRAHGRVYAVDTSQERLDYISNGSDIVNDNVITVLAEPDDPKLPEGEIEIVLAVNFWHHVEDRAAYLKKLSRALRDTGRVAIIDWSKDPMPQGPPAEDRLSRDTVVAEFKKAGWTLTSESFMFPRHYFLMFVPPRSRSSN